MSASRADACAEAGAREKERGGAGMGDARAAAGLEMALSGGFGPLEDDARQRRERIDELLSGTFNSILRIEERSLDNRLTHGLTITEVHTIAAVGLHGRDPMNVVASRLGVTLATLTAAVGKLAAKGFVERTRAEDDRRKVLVSLTKKGRQVLRAHNLFHRQMIDEAMSGLTEEEERVFAAALAKVKGFFDERA